MSTAASPVDYANRSRALAVIGVVLLLVGLGCLALGPAEMYCFYFFTAGGRFHYEGFGFGSLMFAFLAVQVLGYYVIALVCIPLGYGHLRPRRWARTIALAGMGFWGVVGLPLVVVFLVVWLLAKDLSVGTVIASLPAMALLYPVLPLLLTRFYRSRDVCRTFESRDPKSYWTEDLPLPLLTLCMLYIFWALALHIAILLRSAFPLFGVLVTDLPGALWIDAAVLGLLCVTWGTFKRRAWAWWGALVGFGLWTLSTVWTLCSMSWLQLLRVLKFAKLEMEALDGVPLQGWHLAAFVGLPLVGTLAVILYAKPHFRTDRATKGS